MEGREHRIMAVRDGRRLPPRNSRGEFRRRYSRRDRGMDYEGEDMRMRDYGDMMRRGRYGDYNNYNMSRMDRMDYAGDMGDYRGYDGNMDGHHPEAHGSTYYPIQAMGTFEGYYGMPEQDYGRVRSFRGEMRGRGRDYGYPMYDMRGYDYGDYGDYGETLSEKELEHWNKKLLGQLDEREKQMFNKDAIMQKVKSMNKPMEGFSDKELYTATLMVYTDYKHNIGANPDLAVKLAYDWLADKDVAVKGAEKLAVYYDCIVEGDD